MKLLEERIKRDGEILPGNILKVSSFLNHQIDVQLLDELGAEFVRLYKGCTITKVLTIESSGIAIACSVARQLNVPVVFAKKHQSSNVTEDCYITSVWSFTHSCSYNVVVSKKFLSSADKILLVDDFLANGSALSGLVDIARQAEAQIQGACIVIEKGFQDGGKQLREKGLRIESLAVIDNMSTDGGITFRR
jgi:xanthine phosphoribosyltransferase